MKLLKKLNDCPLYLRAKNIDYSKFKKVIVVFYSVFFIVILYHFIYARRIIPGVNVAGIDVGGMTFSKAKDVLQKKESSIDRKLRLTHNDELFIITAEDIALEYDWESSVVRAFEVGRTGNIFVDTKDKIVGIFKNLVIPASFDFDDDSLGIKISIIKGSVNIEPTQSEIILSESGLEVTPSAEGKKIVEEEFYEIVITSINNLEFSDKTIPVKIIKPQVTENEAERFIGVVEKILSEDLIIKFSDRNWVLGKSDILGLLKLEERDGDVKLVLNDYAFDLLSDSIAMEINEFPKGDVVSTNGNIVTEFRIVEEGKELDVEMFERDITQSIFNDRQVVNLAVNVVTDESDKSKYGIVALLGEGTSHYKGSIPGRIHNLTLAAKNMDGALIPPGAVFSMNQSVGPIDYQHGFQSAYIIKGGRTVLGEGGGVCQTSTTLFRAVLNSGLPIISRYPHAYRVGYYEQDMPVGFDAAVFQPSWDFKFKNDTQGYVLIQTDYNLDESSLTFRLYGTPDGRVAEISKPVITGQSPPPQSLYEDDPNLAKGVVIQVDYSAWGATSSFTRTVRMGDEVLFTDTYTSKYQPWRAIYKVGTKE